MKLDKCRDRMSKKQIVVIYVLFIAAYYIALIATYSDNSSLQKICTDAFSIAGEIIAIVTILYSICQMKNHTRVEWIFFLIAVFCNLIGDIIWSLYDNLWNIEVSEPSVCDIFYIAGSILFIAALYTHMRKQKIYFIIKTGFDMAIITTASLTIIYRFLWLKIWNNEQMPFLAKLVTILYPVMDFIFLTGIFSMLYSRTEKAIRNRTNQFLIMGFSVMGIADILFAVLGIGEAEGYFWDPLWSIGFLCIALASVYAEKKAIYEEEIGIAQEKLRIYQTYEYFCFLFPYFLASFVILFVNYSYIKNNPVAIGSLVTVLLIMIRQIFAIMENRKLMDLLLKSYQEVHKRKTELELKNKSLKKLNKKRETEARTDYLTNMYNRRYIMERMTQDIENMDEKHSMMDLSLMFIDIDDYKEINDQFGHDMGDVVLRQIGEIIKGSIRMSDIAGRYGGDEFILILPKTNLQMSEMIAERLCRKVREMKFEAHPELKVTLSIGNIHWKGTKETYFEDHLINAADAALYEAKNAGKNRVVSKQV